LCSSDIPSGADLPQDSIWYAIGTDTESLRTVPAIPSEIGLIATESRDSAIRITSLGTGVPAIGIGRAEASGDEDIAAWRDIASGLEAAANALDQSTGEREALAARSRLQVAVVTTWNEHCGLFTHSAELVGAFGNADIRIYAPRDRDLVGRDERNVYRFWRHGKDENQLSDMLLHLRRSPVDMVIVQFNYGFYNHGELDRFMQAVSDLGIIVFLILHSTVNPSNALNWRLADLKRGMLRCGRVIVHAPRDVERLAKFGVSDNVLLMPHGVVVRQKKRKEGVLGATPVLATFGFCFPNKGLVELITAVRILRDRGLRVHLKMFNALHPSDGSRDTLAAMKASVQDFGLSDQVEIMSDFLDLEEVEKAMADIDLFVNPYQHTAESASGAVRLGLRAALPTLVTPLQIFDDLHGAVFRASGTTPDDIAASIERVLAQLRDNGKEAQQVRAALDEWLSVHDFRRQAERLGRICRSEQLSHIVGATGALNGV
jgi:glycosyltransferase involved in cell wall biosynthesis